MSSPETAKAAEVPAKPQTLLERVRAAGRRPTQPEPVETDLLGTVYVKSPTANEMETCRREARQRGEDSISNAQLVKHFAVEADGTPAFAGDDAEELIGDLPNATVQKIGQKILSLARVDDGDRDPN